VTRPIGHKAGHYLAGFIVAKLVVAIALAVGMASLTGPASVDSAAPIPPGATVTATASTGAAGTGSDPATVLGTLLGGSALLAMAAFTPMLVVRLLPLAEGAISAGSGGRLVAKAAMAAKALS